MPRWRPDSRSFVILRLLSVAAAAPLLILACSHDWDAYDPRGGAGTAAGGAGPDAGAGPGTGGAEPGADAGSGTGGAEPDAGEDAGPTHVTEGLIALYTFEEGQGATVHDVSDVAPALDLTIQDPGAVTWAKGALVIAMPTLITSGVAASKVIQRCMLTSEITLEAWVSPTSADVSGPARIVTNSINTTERNFTLGQEYTSFYQARIRSTLSMDTNGSPFLQSPSDAGDVKLGLTHLLVTRDADGVRRMYVNAVEVATDMLGGDFSNWETSYPLLMADELGGSRSWLGELYRIAIYERALSAAEVAQSFTAGP